jgi:hypothetical protein
VYYHNHDSVKCKESSQWNTIAYYFKPVFLNMFNYICYINYQKFLVIHFYVNLVCTSASFVYWDVLWRQIICLVWWIFYW